MYNYVLVKPWFLGQWTSAILPEGSNYLLPSLLMHMFVPAINRKILRSKKKIKISSIHEFQTKVTTLY